MLQLYAIQEFRMSNYVLADDATETELAEMAAEQRALAVINNNEPVAGTVLLNELRISRGIDA
jgi:hypothetical protein